MIRRGFLDPHDQDAAVCSFSPPMRCFPARKIKNNGPCCFPLMSCGRWDSERRQRARRGPSRRSLSVGGDLLKQDWQQEPHLLRINPNRQTKPVHAPVLVGTVRLPKQVHNLLPAASWVRATRRAPTRPVLVRTIVGTANATKPSVAALAHTYGTTTLFTTHDSPHSLCSNYSCVDYRFPSNFRRASCIRQWFFLFRIRHRIISAFGFEGSENRCSLDIFDRSGPTSSFLTAPVPATRASDVTHTRTTETAAINRQLHSVVFNPNTQQKKWWPSHQYQTKLRRNDIEGPIRTKTMGVCLCRLLLIFLFLQNIPLVACVELPPTASDDPSTISSGRIRLDVVHPPSNATGSGALSSPAVSTLQMNITGFLHKVLRNRYGEDYARSELRFLKVMGGKIALLQGGNFHRDDVDLYEEVRGKEKEDEGVQVGLLFKAPAAPSASPQTRYKKLLLGGRPQSRSNHDRDRKGYGHRRYLRKLRNRASLLWRKLDEMQQRQRKQQASTSSMYMTQMEMESLVTFASTTPLTPDEDEIREVLLSSINDGTGEIPGGLLANVKGLGGVLTGTSRVYAETMESKDMMLDDERDPTVGGARNEEGEYLYVPRHDSHGDPDVLPSGDNYDDDENAEASVLNGSDEGNAGGLITSSTDDPTTSPTAGPSEYVFDVEETASITARGFESEVDDVNDGDRASWPVIVGSVLICAAMGALASMLFVRRSRQRFRESHLQHHEHKMANDSDKSLYGTRGGVGVLGDLDDVGSEDRDVDEVSVTNTMDTTNTPTVNRSSSCGMGGSFDAGVGGGDGAAQASEVRDVPGHGGASVSGGLSWETLTVAGSETSSSIAASSAVPRPLSEETIMASNTAGGLTAAALVSSTPKLEETTAETQTAQVLDSWDRYGYAFPEDDFGCDGSGVVQEKNVTVGGSKASPPRSFRGDSTKTAPPQRPKSSPGILAESSEEGSASLSSNGGIGKRALGDGGKWSFTAPFKARNRKDGKFPSSYDSLGSGGSGSKETTAVSVIKDESKKNIAQPSAPLYVSPLVTIVADDPGVGGNEDDAATATDASFHTAANGSSVAIDDMPAPPSAEKVNRALLDEVFPGASAWDPKDEDEWKQTTFADKNKHDDDDEDDEGGDGERRDFHGGGKKLQRQIDYERQSQQTADFQRKHSGRTRSSSVERFFDNDFEGGASDNVSHVSTPTREEEGGPDGGQKATGQPSSQKHSFLMRLRGTNEPSGAFPKDGSFPRFSMSDEIDDDGNNDDDDNINNGREPSPKGYRHMFAMAASNKSLSSSSRMYLSSSSASGLHPLDWSDVDTNTIGTTDVSNGDMSDLEGKAIWDQYLLEEKRRKRREQREREMLIAAGAGVAPFHVLPPPAISAAASFSTGLSSTTCSTSHSAKDRDIINDILWLEKKIADRTTSFISDDATIEEDGSTGRGGRSGEPETPPMHSIVCRDCYAPPGRLDIVVRSTKDGPSIHAVQSGSALENQLFEGDLIIAVDNVDTRAMTAEQVMSLMQARGAFERKITVLHFGESD